MKVLWPWLGAACIAGVGLWVMWPDLLGSKFSADAGRGAVETTSGQTARVAAQGLPASVTFDAQGPGSATGGLLGPDVWSQRMMTAACLAMSGIDPQDRYRASQEAHAQFQTGLQTATRDAQDELRAAIDAFLSDWARTGPAVLQLAAGDILSVAVRQMLEGDQRLHEAAMRYRDAHDAQRPGAMTATHRLATFGEVLLKDACFLAAGHDAARSLQSLRDNTDRFITLLDGLRTQAARVGASPIEAAAAQGPIDRVHVHWESYRTALSLIEPGAPGNRAQLAALAGQSDALLRATAAAITATTLARAPAQDG